MHRRLFQHALRQPDLVRDMLSAIAAMRTELIHDSHT
jgi:hypothetical protein